MRNKQSNIPFVFCIFLVIIIISFFLRLLFTFLSNNKNSIESFTPKVREMYRPRIRNIRIVYDNLYNSIKVSATNLLRKLGLI